MRQSKLTHPLFFTTTHKVSFLPIANISNNFLVLSDKMCNFALYNQTYENNL